MTYFKTDTRAKHRILVVEPNEALRQKLCAFLTDYYPATVSCASGRALEAELERAKPSLIVLSNDLPDIGNAAVLCDLRAMYPDVAVLAIGDAHEWMDAVICLELGADDFVKLPCNEREVLSRIRNLLRHRASEAAPAIPVDSVFSLGDFVLDLKKRSLRRKTEVIEIHDRLVDLLVLFARNPMIVMSRLRLMRQLDESGCSLSERSVDVLVCRLRQIVEDDPSKPRLIHTIRGQGYAFSPSGVSIAS